MRDSTLAVNSTQRALVRQCALFAALNDATLNLLLASARFETYPRGRLLFSQEQVADRFFLVLSGRIRIFRAAPDGRQQILHVFGPGEVCGEVPMFQGGVYPASAEAACAARTLALARDAFLASAQQHPEILLSMLASLSERLRRFVGMIEDLSLRSVPNRVARHLLEQAQKQNRAVFELEGSKTEVAGRLGTTPESLSRALARLQTRQVIAMRGRTIRIKDEAALRWMSEGMEMP